jgi:arylsulfatase A-like enzyme
MQAKLIEYISLDNMNIFGGIGNHSGMMDRATLHNRKKMFTAMKSGKFIVEFFKSFYRKSREFFRNNEQFKRVKDSKSIGILSSFYREYWLLCFFILLIMYLELLYRVWIFRDLSFDYFFALIFAVSGGAAIYILVSLFPLKLAKKVSALATLILTILYGVQLIYFCIFRTPFSLISLGAAGDVVQFWDIVLEAIWKNAVAVVLLFLPFVGQLVFGKHLVYYIKKQLELNMVLAFCILSFSLSVACVALTGDGPTSQYTLYFDVFSPELSVNRLGVLTTVRLDVERLVEAALQDAVAGNVLAAENSGNDEPDGSDGDGDVMDIGNSSGSGIVVGSSGGNAGNQTGDGIGEQGPEQSEDSDPTGADEPAKPVKPYNVMEIDFETLMASGEKDPLYPMHKYFSTVEPTATNEYTGMFAGCNLIMFTAEGFSPYAVSPELTPTLYKMINEGFVFNNFYNPVWWVSTSDGEYVACTGLMPKSGVWSMARSGSNYMPFAMGNQLRKLGYTTKAYHNHTYTYYKRDVSHPNLGYDYKGVGNGLEVKKTWPESDLEMIDVTFDEYGGQQPFHAYYMTVSGHMNYNFFGNHMASKNKQYVDHLPYSDEAKAYIACNLELEFAMKSLMDKLEAAGIAENTVIVLSPDHYPYGLERDKLNELAGHEVESNFELYKSTLIIYKKGMEPVVVDKPCASLDIIPTVSNLFGLEYDSRLLMGTDILSSTPPLVIFSNRSWITDRAMYNSQKNKVTFLDGTQEDKEYVKKVNRIVADKFKFSTKILETDYYGKVLKEDEQKNDE